MATATDFLFFDVVAKVYYFRKEDVLANPCVKEFIRHGLATKRFCWRIDYDNDDRRVCSIADFSVYAGGDEDEEPLSPTPEHKSSSIIEDTDAIATHLARVSAERKF